MGRAEAAEEGALVEGADLAGGGAETTGAAFAGIDTGVLAGTRLAIGNVQATQSRTNPLRYSR